MSQIKVKVRDAKTLRAPSADAASRTTRRQASARPKPRSMVSRLVKPLGFLILISLFIAGPWWAISSGYFERLFASLEEETQDTFRHVGFSLEDLVIEGRQNTPSPKILEALGIRKGQSIFQLDLNATKDRLEAMPWVRAAMISRELPGVLHIRLSEHQPIALFQENGKLFYVNERGELFGQALQKYTGQWMVVTGADAPFHAPALLKELEAFPSLKKRLTGAVLMGKRRWDLIIDSRLRLKLPEEDMSQALHRFIQFDQQSTLSSKDITAVDLRFSDKTYFQLTPEGAKLRKSKSGQMIKS